MLSVDAIKSFLKNDSLNVMVFDELDSTNSEAKRKAKQDFSAPFLILADSQTNGRGRLGRSFYSPSATGIYLSYVYVPDGEIASVVAVTSAAAVAVSRAIESVTSKSAKIKWVNDIYIDGKKVCGILCEAVTTGASSVVIVGIGINVSTVYFPNELSEKAGSLSSGDINRNRLAAEVVNQLEAVIEGLSTRDFINDYKERSLVLGKQVTYIKNGEETVAEAVDIDRDGGLIVTLSDGSINTLNSGEISLKI